MHAHYTNVHMDSHQKTRGQQESLFTHTHEPTQMYVKM